MLMMSKPRRPHKDEDPAGIYWFEDAARLQRLYEYCKQDGEVERELWERLQHRPLPPAELLLWQLDAKINARGFHVDRELAEAARAVARATGPEIDAELAEVTGGAVTGVNQIARLQAWLSTQGCKVTSLDKKHLEELLADELPASVRRVLELRQSGAQAAAKKIDALLACCSDDDDRARGLLRYHVASTGRWAGNGFQPQNLKRPETENIDAAIAAISTGEAQVQRYPRPLAVVGDIAAALICAEPGQVLIGADFGAIESRVLAWIAGEEWELDSYRPSSHQDPRTAILHQIFRVRTAPSTTNRRNASRQDLRSRIHIRAASARAQFEAGAICGCVRWQFKARTGALHIRRSSSSGTT
jgi:DNA polymerase